MAKLLLSTFSKEGGPGNVLATLAKEFISIGHQVEVKTSTDSSLWEDWRSLPVHAGAAALDAFIVKKDKTATLSLMRDMAPSRQIVTNDYDGYIFGWINGHISSENIKGPLFGRTLIRLPDENFFTGGCHYSKGCTKFQSECKECPIVRAPFRGLINSNWKRKGELLRSFHDPIFIAPSAWIAEQASESSLLKKAEIHVIRNPIDRVFFEQKPATLDVRRQLARVHIVASQLEDPIKGASKVLSALQPLLSTGLIDLRLIGNASKSFRARHPHATFLGRLNKERIAKELAHSMVLLSPSSHEAAGNVIMEAMASGVPVSAKRRPGVEEFMIQDTVGLSFKHEKELPDLITGLLKGTPSKRSPHSLRQASLLQHPSVIAEQYAKLLRV